MMSASPGSRRLSATFRQLTRIAFGVGHVRRFLRRAGQSHVYPLVFNEPLNWVEVKHPGRGFPVLRWTIPAVPWHLGQPPDQLPGLRLFTSERIAELPFAHRCLVSASIQPPARVLEFGCVHSRLAIELATLGYRVDAVDLMPYPSKHPNLRFLQGNITTLDLELGAYDAATAISVIEHAGLQGEAGYGQAAAGEDDLVIVSRLKSLLCAGGLLIMTVPFGQAGIGGGYRVYDSAGLAALSAGWEVQEALYLCRVGTELWTRCEAEELADVDSAAQPLSPLFPVAGAALLALRKQ